MGSDIGTLVLTLELDRGVLVGGVRVVLDDILDDDSVSLLCDGKETIAPLGTFVDLEGVPDVRVAAAPWPPEWDDTYEDRARVTFKAPRSVPIVREELEARGR